MNFRITMTGTSAVLMHNGRLADPLDPATKSLRAATAKRGKTDDDLANVSRLEMVGGLYFDPDTGPYLPADNLWATLRDAAKKTRQGKLVIEGVIITSEVNPLVYPGPRDLPSLTENPNFVFRKTVVVQRQRIVRTRPIFQQWKCDAEGILDESVLDFADLKAIADRAGQLVGIGDWRPRFGRFEATVEAL